MPEMNLQKEWRALLDRARELDEQLQAYDNLNEQLNKQFEAHRFTAPLDLENSYKNDQDKKKEKIYREAEAAAQKYKAEYIKREMEKAGFISDDPVTDQLKEMLKEYQEKPED